MFRETVETNIAFPPSVSWPAPKARGIEIHPIPERFKDSSDLLEEFDHSVKEILEDKKAAILGQLKGSKARRAAKHILESLFFMGQISMCSRIEIEHVGDCKRKHLLCVMGNVRPLVSQEEVIGSFVFHKSRRQQTEKYIFAPLSFIEPGLILKLPLSENTREELAELVTKIGEKIKRASTPIEIMPALQILRGAVDWVKAHACAHGREYSLYYTKFDVLQEAVREAASTGQLNSPNRANEQVREIPRHPHLKKRQIHQRRPKRNKTQQHHAPRKANAHGI